MYVFSSLADGTSTSPCSDTYGGPSPASAPETRTIQDRANELGPNLRAFITTHTAANMYLHPFGNTLDGNCEYSADHDHQVRLTRSLHLFPYRYTFKFDCSFKWQKQVPVQPWQHTTRFGLTETLAKRSVS